jgi:aminopeptidase N
MDVETMNEDVFFKMMRHWYLKYLGKFATTADFQAHVEQYVGMDMTWFFQQWVYGNDLPTYKFKYDLVRQADGTFTANCKVTTKDVADDFKMYLPIEIVFDDDRRVYARILIDQPEMQFPIEGIVERPDKLRLNPFESVLCKVKQ